METPIAVATLFLAVECTNRAKSPSTYAPCSRLTHLAVDAYAAERVV